MPINIITCICICAILMRMLIFKAFTYAQNCAIRKYFGNLVRTYKSYFGNFDGPEVRQCLLVVLIYYATRRRRRRQHATTATVTATVLRVCKRHH